MNQNYEGKKKYYEEHMQDIISMKIRLKCKDDNFLSYLVKISLLLDNKFKGISDIHKELFTEAVFSLFEYLRREFPTLMYSYEEFENVIEKNLKKIFFCKKPGFDEHNYSSYKLKRITINIKLIDVDYEQLLCYFTHELIHCISNDANFTGFVKNIVKRKGIVTNIIQDVIYDCDIYSRLNEMETEYIMIQALDENFNIKYKKYNFLFDKGEKIELITKGVSYRHIFIYVDILNFITENRMVGLYLFPTISIKDFLILQYPCMYEEFLEYLNNLNAYAKNILNYDTKRERHNKENFERMIQSYEKLIETYLISSNFSDEQYSAFRKVLTGNMITIDNSENIFEQLAEKFDEIYHTNVDKEFN